VLAEMAEGPLNGVALPVGGGAGDGWPAAVAAAPLPVAGLVGGLGDSGLDTAAAQVSADGAAGVRLVAQDLPGPAARPPQAAAADGEPAQQRQERQRIVALPGAGHPGQWPAA